MSNDGFYKRRRGVVEHIETGTIDLLENGIHDYLSLKANMVIGNGYHLPAGVVSTSAPALQARCKRVSERTIQRILAHLEEIGWIKTWKVAGKHGNYLALICRASVHDLSGNEYRVNGEKTTDWRYPVYELVGEVSGSCQESVSNVAGLRELRVENREKRRKKNPAAKTAPPADPRFQPFFKLCYEAFRLLHLQPPTWGERDGKKLRDFLKQQPRIEAAEWERRYTAFLKSSVPYFKQQHGSLGFFAENFDKFIEGPILEKGKSNGNAKPTVGDAMRTTLDGFRQLESGKAN